MVYIIVFYSGTSGSGDRPREEGHGGGGHSFSHRIGHVIRRSKQESENRRASLFLGRKAQYSKQGKQHLHWSGLRLDRDFQERLYVVVFCSGKGLQKKK